MEDIHDEYKWYILHARGIWVAKPISGDKKNVCNMAGIDKALVVSKDHASELIRRYKCIVDIEDSGYNEKTTLQTLSDLKKNESYLYVQSNISNYFTNIEVYRSKVNIDVKDDKLSDKVICDSVNFRLENIKTFMELVDSKTIGMIINSIENIFRLKSKHEIVMYRVAVAGNFRNSVELVIPRKIGTNSNDYTTTSIDDVRDGDIITKYDLGSDTIEVYRKQDGKQ